MGRVEGGDGKKGGSCLRILGRFLTGLHVF